MGYFWKQQDDIPEGMGYPLFGVAHLSSVAITILFLVSVHRFGIGYLPLHICSIGIFIFLLRELLPWRQAKKALGEISFMVIMPASIVALMFADWTVYYPVLNFMNIHSYVWHGMLILYPMLLKVRGDINAFCYSVDVSCNCTGQKISCKQIKM